MASLFTGPVGWAGLAIVGISAAGLWIWNGVKEANKHEPGSDGGTSLRFLQHAGLNENTARALTDQSGDGHSPVPIFQRYAELKGYDLSQPEDQQKFVKWLNAMPVEELGQARDRIHRELDSLDGDTSKFGKTAEAHRPSRADFMNPWSLRPRSMEQLDSLLAYLKLTPLPAA